MIRKLMEKFCVFPCAGNGSDWWVHREEGEGCGERSDAFEVVKKLRSVECGEDTLIW